MQGYFSDIIVGGFTNTAITDNTGPEIQIYMNDTLFRNGGITDINPRLLAIIEDEGGINTTGSGIGHDLTGFLDDDPNNSFVLNNYFENDIDNYTRGKIIYDLSGLTKGSHKLTLKAWDNFNNSSENSLIFVVETDGKFIIKNLMNYPNPFINETTISADHNRPDNELEIIIRIFSMNGGLIKTFRSSVKSAGFAIPPIKWDGTSDGGERISSGIYPYTLSLTSDNGESAVASGRMIIL
jgi:hypothetical protein